MKIRAGGGNFRAGGGSFRAAGCSPLLFLFMGNTNLPFYFQGYRILLILLPEIWDPWFNILLLPGILKI